MAAGGRIAGITIQLGADTRSLVQALKDTNTVISRTQKELKMVERALQLDPGNAELLRQQQELLQEAVSETTTKLDALRQAQAEVERKFQAGEISAVEYRSFNRELITTEQSLERLTRELAEFGQQATETEQTVESTNSILARTQNELKQVERALQLDSGNVELLRQQQELLQQAVSTTSTRLDELRQSQAEVERQFQAGELPAEEYRAFQRELIQTEQNLERFTRELDELGQEATEARRSIEEVGRGVRDAGQGIKDAGQNMMGVTAGMGAVAGASALVATQFDDMGAKIRNTMDLTEEEAQGMEETVKNLWREGFGESLEDVTNSLIQVKNNMRDLPADEIENVTRQSMVLAQAWDADVNEVTRAGSNLMTNFGVTSGEAFDIMAKGAKNGMNFSNEMFDNLAEYSSDFARAGFTIDDMFNTLIHGAQTGTYNLDQLNDVVREFGIQGSENVTGFADGISRLSPETQKVYQNFENGKATMKDVMDASIADLKKMDDQVAMNQIGTSLFGAKWGDVGAQTILAMGGATDALGDYEGAMNEMVETQEQTFGQRFQSMLRTAQEALLPVGEIILDLASKYLPPLIEKITALAEWFKGLSTQSQMLVMGIGAFVAALGPALIIIGSLVSAIGTLIAPLGGIAGVLTKLKTAFTAVRTAVMLLTTSFGMPIVIIGALVAAGVLLYKNWDLVKEKAGQLKDWTVKKFNELKQGASDAIQSAKTAVSTKFNELKTNASTAVENAKKAVTDKFNQIKTGMTNTIQSAKTAVVDRFNQIKTGATNAVQSARTAVVDKFNQIKTGATSAVENARSAIVSKFNAVKTGISSAVDLAKSKVSTVFSNIKNLMTNPVETAQKAIKTAIDKISGFFSNLKLKLPDIKLPKLPKFKLTGEFSLNPPRVPKLSVNWNAKGGIFNKPTIFNTSAGLQGVGEAGREAILPLTEKVLGGIGEGIAKTMSGGQSIVINPQPIYLDGELIGEVTFDTINRRQFTSSQMTAISRGVQL